ncbi:fimbrial protein [Citrobacter freundii]|uniref:Fimbrial protein n=1 Tax=Citrobacter portucalensis TaxID=1639133 RepID=A0A9X4GE98_9ENTR|nr:MULTISPECIES: fimbrial-like protein [Citrobacter freundii complex]MDE9617637.1 fimbrial protein [Citrobacter portucalensis]QLR79020.1 fimbrial protein [Citrobacter freundii]
MLSRRQCSITLYLGLISALLPLLSYSQDVDLTATVTNNTCRIEISNNGVVNLPTVKPGYFADGVTAETDYPGGKEFAIRLVECPISDGKISQVMVNFTPQDGSQPMDNPQVFANDLTVNDEGVKNVGLAIFTNQPNTSRTNVLNTDGSTRAIYPVTAEHYQNSLWPFYARMQKIVSAENVSSGLLTSKVLVNISYQ